MKGRRGRGGRMMVGVEGRVRRRRGEIETGIVSVGRGGMASE